MEEYEVTFIVFGHAICSALVAAESACQAVENGIKQGSLYMPSSNTRFEAVVVNFNSGLVFHFNLNTY